MRRHRRIGGAAAATLAAVLVVPAGAAAWGRPGPRPKDEVIVFDRVTAGPGSPSAIWVMDGDGGHARALTAPPPGASDTHPAIARTGELYVYERTPAGGVPQLYLGDLLGFDPGATAFGRGRITNAPGGARDPSLAPLGGTVAFSAVAGDTCDVWLAEPDGTRARRLTGHGGRAATCDDQPTWSPDGRRVLFRRTAGDPAHPLSAAELSVPAKGGAASPVRLAGDEPLGLSWQLGGRLVYTTARGGRGDELRSITAAGRSARTISSAATLLGAPVWSPDGGRAAFTRQLPGGGSDVMTVGASGRGLADLTGRAGGGADPSWGFQQGGLGGGEPSSHVHARSVRPRRRSFRRRGRTRTAKRAPARHYAGATAQRGRRVSFTVSGGRVRGLTFSWSAACTATHNSTRDAPLVDTTQIVDALRLRGGRFRATGWYRTAPGSYQLATVPFTIAGAVRDGRASGTLSIGPATILYAGIYLSDACSTPGRVRWTAR